MATVCDKNLEEFINEIDNDVDRLDRALQDIDYNSKLQAGVWRNKRTGGYTIPSKRISLYSDKVKELVGKVISFVGMDSNTFKDVRVKSAELISSDVASINDGQHYVDMKNGRTTNGEFIVEMGSEEDTRDRHTEKLTEISGTVTADIDNIISATLEIDKDSLSEESKGLLTRVISIYKDTLLEAGKDVDLNIEVMKDLDDRGNAGLAHADGKITLINGNGRYNSQTEIVAHELQHVLIQKLLDSNKELATKVLRLRDAMAKSMNPNVFISHIKDPTEADLKFAKERFEYVFKNKNPDHAAGEFLAAATTNPQLMAEMGMIKDTKNVNLINLVAPKKSGDKLGKLDKFWNSLAKAINAWYRTSVFNKGNTREYALDLLDAAMKQAHKKRKEDEVSVFKKAIDKLMNMDKRLAEYTNEVKKENKGYKDNIKRTEKNFVDKAIDNLWKVKGLARVRSLAVQNNVFSTMSRDMDNKDVAKFYQMFRHSKAFVDNAVVPIEHATLSVLYEDFKLDKMDEELRRSSKRILIDADAKVLGTVENVKEYLEDSKKVEDELAFYKTKYGKDVSEAIEATGELLVSNKMTSINGYVNATQIAFDILGNVDKQSVTDIDIAITLEAIKRSDPADIRNTVKAIDENPEALNHAITLKAADEASLLKKAYYDDKMYEVKGAKQERFVGDKKHYIVNAEEAKELAKGKMVNLGKNEELSTIIGKDVFIFVGDNVQEKYTEGMLSKVQLKNEGDSLKHLLYDIGGMTEDEAEERISELSDGHGQSAQALIPERSGTGSIYDYKFRIPHSDKVAYLGMDDDIVRVIGKTVSNLTHKQEAMLNNRASVSFLDRFYKKYKDDKSFKFLEISEESEGKFKEYWDTIPYYLKATIKKKHKGKLMVEESMLVDYFGYNDVSLVNAPWIQKSVKRKAMAKKIEGGVQEITKAWKQSVVAKTLDTVVGNNSSNMFVALVHTTNKNPLVYLNKYREKWGHLNRYQKLKKRRAKLEISKRAGVPVEDEVFLRIDTEMQNSPVHAIMKDGQFSSIMEDIDGQWLDETGIIEEKLNEIMEKAKRKNGKVSLKEVVDFLYIRKDSKFHDSVMKGTTYSDAINKMIIMDDIVETKKMTEVEALNYVDQLHVNYSYLDNRWIKYANDTLIFSFTKYFFRVMPAMLRVMKRKGVSLFLLESAQGATGLDVETPMDQFFDPFAALSRKVTGWGDPLSIFGNILTPAYVK